MDGSRCVSRLGDRATNFFHYPTTNLCGDARPQVGEHPVGNRHPEVHTLAGFLWAALFVEAHALVRAVGDFAEAVLFRALGD
jgi:hypothetical protein